MRAASADAPLSTATEARVRRLLAQSGVPGASVAWIDREGARGQLVHGVTDAATHVPVEATTRFHLFSGTKLYTAAAVMRLVEEGAVTLDASVRRYLPELPLRDDLTVAHLASHASGLPDTLRAFLATHLEGDRVPTTREALARYRLERGGAPGGRAHYGNVNYAILGELVSRVSGVPFENFVGRTLLEPLGASLAFHDDGVGSASGHVGRFSPMLLLLRVLFPDVARRIGAARAGGLVTLRPFSLDTAAIGGLVGSAQAFLPFLREMLEPGDGALRATSKRTMLSVRTEGAAGIVSRDGVGLGWKRGRVGSRTFFNHEGGGAGFATETRLYPAEGLGVVVLTNLTHGRGLSRMAHDLCEALRDERVSGGATTSRTS